MSRLPEIAVAALSLGAALAPPAGAFESPLLTLSADMGAAVGAAVQQDVQPAQHPCPVEQPQPPSTPACVSAAERVAGIQRVDVGTIGAAACGEQAQANLVGAKLTHDSIEVSASCVESRIPVVATKGVLPAFYRFQSRALWMESGLQYLGHSGPATLRNLCERLGDLKRYDAGADAALIAATAFREAGVSAWQPSDTRVVSERHAWGLDGNVQSGGGLNNLALLPSKYLPPAYRGKWVPSENMIDSFHGLTLPQKDLPVAYGAWMAFSRDIFEKDALAAGFTQAQLDSMSVDARRVWQGIFFEINGGAAYGSGHKGDLPGGHTVLTHLKALIDDHKASSLDDIVSNEEIYKNYKIVRLSVAVAANAALISARTGWN